MKNNTKDKPLLWIGALILLSYCSLAFGQSATDNVINISNPSSSDNLNLSIQQAGYDNEVTLSIGGSSNTLDIYQLGAKNTTKYTDTWGSGYNWGGDLAGNNNDITVKQYTDTSKSISDNYTASSDNSPLTILFVYAQVWF